MYTCMYPTNMTGIITYIHVIKNNQQLLPDLADFILQEQPEDNIQCNGLSFSSMV